MPKPPNLCSDYWDGKCKRSHTECAHSFLEAIPEWCPNRDWMHRKSCGRYHGGPVHIWLSRFYSSQLLYFMNCEVYPVDEIVRYISLLIAYIHGELQDIVGKIAHIEKTDPQVILDGLDRALYILCRKYDRLMTVYRSLLRWKLDVRNIKEDTRGMYVFDDNWLELRHHLMPY
jgi:hypothetical protein